ncbi:MAG: hypothetical protein HWD82_09280 [Flavobacteriaceae bacterium]|nr:hypothetical protein [Flavobacteriaceae bacterium]
MKRLLYTLGVLILFFVLAGFIFYIAKNESLPEGKSGKEAEELASKIAKSINLEAFKNTEILEWSFRNEHHYKWYKQNGNVIVEWDKNKVNLNLANPLNSKVFVNGKLSKDKKLIDEAVEYFNNDSFWLVAPYKLFDDGTERKLVDYEGKKGLLITYTSGGTTPGDSYLWFVDKNYKPESFKMWTSIIPIGGVEASWSDLKKSSAGIMLPKSHKLSIFGLEIAMGDVKAYNKKADELAVKVLKAVKHEAYKNTRYLEWSFGGRRQFKWDKKDHVVDVSWEKFSVKLYPADRDKSIVYFEGEKQEDADEKIIKRAWDIFNNDSFWLVAPHKLFDEGTIRNIVNENNKEALKVSYTKGGTTPGDSYIWILDSTYVPKIYKMFVPSMKMNGVPATWEGWITTESGTLLPTSHTFSNGGKLSMGEVKGYN